MSTGSIIVLVLVSLVLIAGAIGWLYEEYAYPKRIAAMTPEELEEHIARGWEELKADSDWQMR
jgi:hypothetical protein